jgi:hypothetical protein
MSNIKQALKQKNKQLKLNMENYSKLTSYNSVEEGAERPYNPEVSMKEWMQGVEDLIELKAKIHRANAKVYDKIFRLAELKSMVKQLRNLDCSVGKQSSYRREEPVVKTTVITLIQRDEMIKKLEVQIEEIQEELDAHNAKTKI